MTGKEMQELHGMSKALNYDHNLLSAYAKMVTGLESMSEMTEDDFNKVKSELTKLNSAVAKNQKMYDKLLVSTDRLYKRNQKAYSERTGKNLPAPDKQIKSIDNNTKLLNDAMLANAIYDEKSEKQRLKNGGKISLGTLMGSYMKVNPNFHNAMAYFSRITGNIKILETAKEFVHGRITVNNIMQEYSLALREQFGDKIDLVITDEDWRDMITYFNTGKVPERIADNDLMKAVMDFLDVMRDRAKGLHRKNRIKNGILNKVKNIEDKYTKEQIEWLDERRPKYAKHLLNKDGEFEKFLQRCQDGTEEGSEIFVIKNYMMLDKADQEKVAPIWTKSKSLFNKVKHGSITGLGDMQSRKGDLGSMVENPIEKIFFSLKRELKREYMGESADALNSELDKSLVRRDYELYEEQLRQILGQSHPSTMGEKAFNLWLGRQFKLVALKGAMQVKNMVQAFNHADNNQERLMVFYHQLSIVFGGKTYRKMYQDEVGMEMDKRVFEETSNKNIVNYMGANRYGTEKVNEFKKFSNIKKGKSTFGAWAVSNLFYNKAAQFGDMAILDRMVDWQQMLDLENRYFVMLTTHRRAMKLFNNENVTWEKVIDKMGLGLLDFADQRFLTNVLVTQGSAEFSVQAGYLHTLLTQYEYDSALKPVFVSASKNVPFVKDIVRGAVMYKVWGQHFQELHRKLFTTLFTKGAIGKKAAARRLIQLWIGNTIPQIMVMMTLGNLPKKDDDDTYADRMRNAVYATFNPGSYGGMYNIGSLLPVFGSYISPFLWKEVLAGKAIYETTPYEIFQGQAGGEIATMLNAISNVIGYYSTKSDRDRDSIRKQILNDGDSLFRHNFLYYSIAERLMSLFTGARRMNLLRQMTKEFGLVGYNFKREERNVLEIIQWLLYEKNPPYIGDRKSKSSFKPTNTGQRSVSRRKGK